MAEILLSRGQKAIVDDCDYERLSKFKWQAVPYQNCMYARRCIRKDGKTISFFMHHEIMGNTYIDHRDGNGLNNKMDNLRECTHSQNMQNRRKHAPASSKFKGVQWWKAQEKWISQIAKDKKRYFLGYFTEEIDAARAYNEAALKHFGEFANINRL